MKLGFVLNIVVSFVACAEYYDYIVVGSGTGGGTLATELAKKGLNTLLIEAGPDYYEANQTVPVFQGKSSEDPAISFDFDVKHYDDNNKTYFYPRAGVLGGCSVHNAMITVYPNTKDFELLKDITGDNGWDEENMRKYFVKLENNQYKLQLPLPLLKPEHGYNGWLFTSYISFLDQLKLDPMLVNLLAAVIGNPLIDVNGYNLLRGLNTDSEAQIFIPQAVNKNDFTRANFPRYIKNIANSGKLTIWTDTFVTKILLDNDKKAYGVDFKRGKYLYKASPLSGNSNPIESGQVLARKEIIISGGTFNTPQLLMLSGIGDKEILNKFNIETKINLPGVGRNMMDRYEVPIVNQYSRNFTLLQGCKFTPTLDDPCYVTYLNERTGPYTSDGALSGQLKKSNSNLNEPDLFILNTISDFHGYFRGYSNNIAKRIDSSTRLILKARTSNTNGQVTLRSDNPFDVPDINFHYFSDSDNDLNILVQSVIDERRFLKRILVNKTELFPGIEIETPDQIKAYVKDIAWGHHACCTAKIGKDSDPLAVLDSQFKVRGAANLRVVDASAIPSIPGYFPALYIHLMAMKVADDIVNSNAQ